MSTVNNGGQRQDRLGRLRLLLGGVPAVSSRGFLGYCTVTAFPWEDGYGLFDTGHFSDRHLLLAALERAGIGPEAVRAVILSHLHFDHVLNLPLFRKAKVYLSRAELEYASRVSAGDLVDHCLPDYWPALLEGRPVELVDDELRLSDSVRLALHPGHTPGCLAMFHEGPARVAVCGDAIKNAWEAVTGRSSMPLAGDDAAAAGIAAILRQAEVFIPGHDRPFSLEEKGPVFLTPFDWEVRASLYPAEREATVLRLSRPADGSGPITGRDY